MPFMPQAATLHDSDILGLAVIMAGLMLYRFTSGPLEDDEEEDDSQNASGNDNEASAGTGLNDSDEEVDRIDGIEGGLREPLLHGDI